MTEKPILDACCGSKMFWFDKHNPAVLYCDNRKVKIMANDGRTFEVNPDAVCDFTAMPFPDKAFKHVVFDPPQMLYAGRGGQMALHYTVLPREWEPIIRGGFDECWRVLDDYGTLVFKWSEHDIPVRKVIEAIGREPLYGHKSGRASKTHWMCFMKIPEERSRLMNNGDMIRNMGNEELAITLMCPNDMGMAEIVCDHSDQCDCCKCLLDWLNQEAEGEGQP